MVLSIELGSDGVPFVQLGEITLRLDLEDLDEEYKERAREELRETPNVAEEAFMTLRNMLKDEEELDVPLDDDSFLMKFLRPCKFYPDSAFRLMKRYYKFRVRHPKYGSGLLPQNVYHVFCQEVVVFLPTRCPGGARIMVINAGSKWSPKKVSLQDMFKSVMMSLEVAMIEPRTQVGGVHVVLNMEGLSLNHVCQFTPSFARTTLEWVQECTPTRLKGVHVINQPFIFNMAYAIFKPFIGEKLRQRIFFHGTNKESLYSQVPADCLPTFYGGTLDIPNYPGSLLADMLCKYEEEFKLCATHGYKNEKVRTDG